MTVAIIGAAETERLGKNPDQSTLGLHLEAAHNALADAGINIEMISTSEIRVSVVTSSDELDEAVRLVHTAFGLDADGEAVVYAGTGR